MRHALEWQKGEEPLLFSAISYGTVIGTTLAAMQPRRVKRFYLDGVTDSEEYYAGEPTGDTVDADASIEKCFEYCAFAGPQSSCSRLWLLS